jgi:hypothetical protein
MVHQPLVSFLVGFESVDTFFKTGKKSRSGPLAIGVGFLRGNNKAVCWPALAHDLSNRIINIHHGVHAGKLSPFVASGKRQGGSGLPLNQRNSASSEIFAKGLAQFRGGETRLLGLR